VFAKLAASKIAQNAGWLMILQLSSYAVPLLLLPYLTRVLGLHAFGELALAWAVLAYAGIFADFGWICTRRHEIC
jgi:PST family polysaccharide transporter